MTAPASPLARRHPDELIVGFVSISDRASAGTYQDEGIPALRDWFYYRARRATAGRFTALTGIGQKVTILGDAAKPGKSKEAIASAFEAALLAK